jgi:DMSO/TMAO reductase YedYZ molybdopterin-dependent catalytic subunit
MRSYRAHWIAIVGLLVLAGCAPAGDTDTPVPTAAVPVALTPTLCALPTIIPPTPPAEIPGYTKLDESTGLHMTGTMQEINLASYRLKVSGKVDNPLSLTYDELRCMPKVELRCTLVCVGFFEDVATWAGTPFKEVLDLAGPQPGASGLRLVSADGYAGYVSLDVALEEDSFLAYEWESEPVPVLHGFPVRAVFASLDGSNWVKWLVEIEVN